MYEEKSIHAGGYRTTYLEAGTPGAATVLLVHDGGFGSTAELCWGSMIPLLAERFHVVAPDMLGWGGTDKVVFLDRPPYASRIEHIGALCRELSIERAHFVGASFGGSVVVRAVCDPTAPWPVDRAVSISGTGGPFRVPDGVAALADYQPSIADARRLTKYMVRDLDGMEEHIGRRHANSLIPGHWEALMAPRLSNPAVERAKADDPFVTLLAKTETPLLFIEGLRDELLESGWSKKLADLAPNAVAEQLDYAHEPNIDAPAETAGLILEFLTEPNA